MNKKLSQIPQEIVMMNKDLSIQNPQPILKFSVPFPRPKQRKTETTTTKNCLHSNLNENGNVNVNVNAANTEFQHFSPALHHSNKANQTTAKKKNSSLI